MKVWTEQHEVEVHSMAKDGAMPTIEPLNKQEEGEEEEERKEDPVVEVEAVKKRKR